MTDTAHLKYQKHSGLEEGTATGTLPGNVKIRFEIGPPVKATFTISTSKGSLSGTGSAALHSAGLYASFGGTITVTHGTGRYAHAHGHGGLYGVVNRHTYALTVQTTGSLSY
ncbi:MAG: autotransporter [Solirubrobacteraceae bacterium]